MGIVYSAAAGYGVVFTEEEVVDFVKVNGIHAEDDYCWECAEAISKKYNLDFVGAGDGMCGGGEYFLFGTVFNLEHYDDNRFKFCEISPDPSTEDRLRSLSVDSGKEPSFYAGMRVS